MVLCSFNLPKALRLHVEEVPTFLISIVLLPRTSVLIPYYSYSIWVIEGLKIDRGAYRVERETSQSGWECSCGPRLILIWTAPGDSCLLAAPRALVSSILFVLPQGFLGDDAWFGGRIVKV